MIKRIVSGLIGAAFLILIVLKGGLLLNISVLIISLIGLYEYNMTVKKNNTKPISIINYIFAISLFIVTIEENNSSMIQLTIMIYILTSMSLLVFRDDLTYKDIGVTVLGGLYIPFSLIHITLLNNSKFIWLIFIIAFGTDTFAYFTGMFFGKRKLCPNLSPKKTVEGSIGGVIGSVILTLIFATFANIDNLLIVIMLGIITSIIAQIGDLAASRIKRLSNIKDYGNIMPGHGGVLDRFDSILFTAPVVYYYISYIF